MARLLPLALGALLTVPAYAADKLALSCVATDHFRPNDPAGHMSLIVDLGQRTVSTVHGVFPISKVTDNLVWFDDRSNSIGGWSGNIDSISGVGRIWHGGGTQYELTCKPAKPLF